MGSFLSNIFSPGSNSHGTRQVKLTARPPLSQEISSRLFKVCFPRDNISTSTFFSLRIYAASGYRTLSFLRHLLHCCVRANNGVTSACG
jgi:hypothetical protein